MPSPFRIIAHHSEAIDPDLWDSIKHQIDEISGLGAESIVVLLGTVLIIMPVALVFLAARKRRVDAARNRMR